MFQKVLLAAVMVFCLAGVAYAVPVSVSLPCAGGGNIAVSGDITNGTFHLEFNLVSCAEGGEVRNGTVTSDGSLGPGDAFTSNTDYDITITEGSDTFRYVSCSEFVNGTYDLASEKLNGTISVGCVGSGTLKVSLVDLFLKVLPFN